MSTRSNSASLVVLLRKHGLKSLFGERENECWSDDECSCPDLQARAILLSCCLLEMLMYVQDMNRTTQATYPGRSIN